MTHVVRVGVGPESAFLILASALFTAVLSVLASNGYGARPTARAEGSST